MTHPALSLDIRRIVTDSDLDGVVTGAILRRWWKDAEVVFGHPGELRAGMLDDVIDRHTAVCDLPRHSQCGLSIDHHQSNAPADDEDNSEMVVVWKPTPSAARIAFELVGEVVDLSDLSGLMEWVDKLDGGSVSKEEFLSDHPVVWLGRIIGGNDLISLEILEALSRGDSVEELLSSENISSVLDEKRDYLSRANSIIAERLEIIDRLAVVRLEDMGVRSNGYRVTALAGEDCDACMVIHGDVGAGFGEEDSYPVSASFYSNSFLHTEGGIFDLTRLATRFDPDGGGHANACGCRIQALENGQRIERKVAKGDIDENIREWLKMWAQR
ncbi:MAG: hypothetical protein VW438_03515 [Euryarchaeota archaeon]